MKENNIYYSQKLKKRAQALRREMTPEEKHLWYDFLSPYPFRFRRQKQFGIYIVDFYCSAAKLVVELDGASHYTEEGKIWDAARTAYLEGLGLKVIRFANHEVTAHFASVCEMIDLIVKRRLDERPHPSDES